MGLMNVGLGSRTAYGYHVCVELDLLEFQIKAWANIVHLAEKQIKASK